jgi:hypothetical protein
MKRPFKIFTKSEENLAVINNFILYYTGDHPHSDCDNMYRAAKDYIEEDHVDGKPADNVTQIYVVGAEWDGGGTYDWYPSRKDADVAYVRTLKEFLNGKPSNAKVYRGAMLLDNSTLEGEENSLERKDRITRLVEAHLEKNNWEESFEDYISIDDIK